jgi:hypothetical protein
MTVDRGQIAVAIAVLSLPLTCKKILGPLTFLSASNLKARHYFFLAKIDGMEIPFPGGTHEAIKHARSIGRDRTVLCNPDLAATLARQGVSRT